MQGWHGVGNGKAVSQSSPVRCTQGAWVGSLEDKGVQGHGRAGQGEAGLD